MTYFQRVLSVVLAIALCGTALFGQVEEAKQAIQNGEHVRAVNILSEMLATRPTNDAYLYLGIAYGNLKEFQKAEDTLREGSNRFPDDVRFSNELAGVYLATKEPDKAKDELRRALTIDSTNAYASDLLASIDISEGEIEVALKYWNKSGQPVVDDILNNSYLTFSSWLVRDALDFHPAGVLRYSQWKTSEARLFEANIFSNVGLDVEPTRVPNHYNAIVLTTSKSNTLSGALWDLVKGLPYQTNYLDFWNIGNSGINWNSRYRWNANKRKLAGRLQVPVPLPGLLHLELEDIWRLERWDYSRIIREEFVDRSKVVYGANRMSISVRHIAHYRFQVGGGIEYANRFAQGDIPQIATDSLNSGTVFLDTTIRFADGVYQNRLELKGFLARQSIMGDFDFSGGTAELKNRLTISKSSRTYLDWALKGGTSRGERPMEYYFILGILMESHPANLLRGHSISRNNQYGNGPTGTDFILSNVDIERRIVTLPMFGSLGFPYINLKYEVFFDAAKTWDRTDVFKDSKLLLDVGAGLKFETPTKSLNVLYGRSLRDGQSVFGAYVEYRLW